MSFGDIQTEDREDLRYPRTTFSFYTSGQASDAASVRESFQVDLSLQVRAAPSLVSAPFTLGRYRLLPAGSSIPY